MPAAVLGLVGAAVSANAAKKGAAAQTAAANNDIAFQKETRDKIIKLLDPFYQGGVTAQNALLYEMGLGEKPMIGAVAPAITNVTNKQGKVTGYTVNGQNFATMEEAQAYANANKTGGTAYQGFTATPGYQFQFDQGTAAVNALAGARGGLNSGRTLQDLTTFGQGLANQEYGNYLARLSGVAGSGQNAAAGQGTAMTNAASGVSNALSNVGNAQAAGASGVANAWTGAINNGLSLWQYQKGLGGGGGLTIGGNLFGGNSWGK